jgi:hypothetical protein
MEPSLKPMTAKEFLVRFVLHAAWALSVFSTVILAMEFIIPGSVTPYVDPIPFAIAALAALSADAFTRPSAPRLLLRIPAGLFIALLTVILIGSRVQAPGKSAAVLIVLVVAMSGMIAWFVLGREEKGT